MCVHMCVCMHVCVCVCVCVCVFVWGEGCCFGRIFSFLLEGVGDGSGWGKNGGREELMGGGRGGCTEGSTVRRTHPI